MTWATMLVSATRSGESPEEWIEVMELASAASMRAYRELIEDPAFIDYFSRATPIHIIESLPIASRPARRRGQPSVTDLRAIPYTFAWTQTRQMITAFYGLGSGLEEAAERDVAVVRKMYQAWPFFGAVIDNAELALAKCDLSIARQYATLVADQGAAVRIWEKIEREYQRARRVVLAITDQAELLAGTRWLKRSIEVRNPYVDPLNLIQVELMRRLGAAREAGRSGEAERLEEMLRLSIQGIAAGLRTTG